MYCYNNNNNNNNNNSLCSQTHMVVNILFHIGISAILQLISISRGGRGRGVTPENITSKGYTILITDTRLSAHTPRMYQGTAPDILNICI